MSLNAQLILNTLSFILDLAPGFHKVICEQFPQAIHVKCAFHLESSWERKFKGKTDFLKAIKQLRIESDETQFQVLLHQLRLDYQDTSELAWFEQNYGDFGHQCPITEWARCHTLGSLPHNLHIERYHRYVKQYLYLNINNHIK